MSHLNQVAPIEVYSPKDADEGDDADDRCLCCGGPMDTVGMCVGCAVNDCPAEFEKECEVTGAVDPLNLAARSFRTEPFSEE